MLTLCAVLVVGIFGILPSGRAPRSALQVVGAGFRVKVPVGKSPPVLQEVVGVGQRVPYTHV
jgi:hypothetical protein